MGKLFSSIARLWEELCKRRRYASQIAPTCIGSMALELARLAEQAQVHVTLSSAEAVHLQMLGDEMRQLNGMTERPEFCRLSADRRLALYDSLQRSREKLLASIQSTQAPTARMQ